jgi:hypothetical protein
VFFKYGVSELERIYFRVDCNVSHTLLRRRRKKGEENYGGKSHIVLEK